MSGPVTVFAPGRVNLLGEHTDYNGGAVLPLALHLGVTVAATPRADGVVTVRSDAEPGLATLLPRVAPADVRPLWARYAAGVLAVLREAGLPVVGFDAEVRSTLPVGAGLASSAAFDVALARAACEIAAERADVPAALRDRARLADLCRAAEERAAGVRCGIMDPFTALHAAAGTALLLDCATLVHHTVPLPADLALVVADSGVRHVLGLSAYGTRRAECEDALGRLRAAGSRARHLCAATEEELARASLPPPLDRRARHAVREHARTLAAADALGAGDLVAFGRLLDASHASLCDDFEVSCDALDDLVERARRLPGVLGARMTGGGFGGCVVTAVRRAAARDVARALGDAVAATYGV